MYEMHFAVPMAGAVLNTINSRLDASSVATILKHSEAKLFFVDYDYVTVARDALRLLMNNSSASILPLVIVIDDIESPTGIRLGNLEYEQLIEIGDPNFVPVELKDEWDPIALNYTSGTTNAPKGVVYSHRGAYLSTMSLILGWEMGSEPVYLWSLPMFHCNGWTFTWGVAARGGTNVCIRNTTPHDIYRNIALHQVTHMCCAPTVFTLLLQDRATTTPELNFNQMNRKVQVLTGGAPPPAALLEQMESLGFHITHAYGLTEATGPALVCEWRDQWNQLPFADQAKLKARQGISVLTLSDADVKDKKTMKSVPQNGTTMGEIVLKGSSLMKGYYKDPKATAEAFKNGYFWTGDVGVVHPDGYIEIKDRSKDVIISGGENISSVEVETKLYTHPTVLEAAVVAMPHSLWGESPCAFVVLKTESNVKVSESDIINHCRKNLSKFMVPKKVVFLKELPKTSTGKVLKNELREMAKELVTEFENACKNQPQVSKNSTKNDRNRTTERLEDRVLVQSRL